MVLLARWYLCDGMLGGLSPSLVHHPVASTKGSWVIGLISCFTMTYKSRWTVQRVWLGLDPGALGCTPPSYGVVICQGLSEHTTTYLHFPARPCK